MNSWSVIRAGALWYKRISTFGKKQTNKQTQQQKQPKTTKQNKQKTL